MGLNTTYRSPFNKFVFLVGLSALAGCSQDTLQAETAEILVVPILGPNQTELVSPSPVGIDLGRIPLYSLNEAVFEIRNVGTANLNIDSVEVESVQGGEIIIVTRPDKLTVQTVGQMKLHATPHKEDVPFTATIAMETNAGLTKSLKVNLRITGEGYFVGEPHLEVESFKINSSSEVIRP